MGELVHFPKRKQTDPWQNAKSNLKSAVGYFLASLFLVAVTFGGMTYVSPALKNFRWVQIFFEVVLKAILGFSVIFLTASVMFAASAFCDLLPEKR